MKKEKNERRERIRNGKKERQEGENGVVIFRKAMHSHLAKTGNVIDGQSKTKKSLTLSEREREREREKERERKETNCYPN